MRPNFQRIPRRGPIRPSELLPVADPQSAAAIKVLLGVVERAAITPSAIRYRDEVRRAFANVRALYDLISDHLTLCESPIEKMLLVEMIPRIVGGGFDIQIQAVHLGSRLDFGLVNKKTGQIILAIECDGHDYHERTKEQARRDRSRDRKLLAAGINTVRFTGSEIYRDAGKCAREVWALAESLA